MYSGTHAERFKSYTYLYMQTYANIYEHIHAQPYIQANLHNT